MLFLEATDPTFSWAAPLILLAALVVCAIITVVLPLLTTSLVKYINAKHGYMVSAEDKQRFDDACRTSMLIVEQNARRALKLGKDAPDGPKKLEEGLSKLEPLLKSMGILESFKDVMADGLEKAVAEMNGPLTTVEKDEIRASLPPQGEDK